MSENKETAIELEKIEEDARKLEEEFQIAVNVDLQKLITHYVEKTNFDPISIVSMIKMISEHYLEQIKEQMKVYYEDKVKFESSIKSDLEDLSGKL